MTIPFAIIIGAAIIAVAVIGIGWHGARIIIELHAGDDE